MLKTRNIILVGSTSIIAQTFVSSANNRYNFVNISRHSCISESCGHVIFDFSINHEQCILGSLIADVQSLLIPDVDVVICLLAWSGTPRSSLYPANSIRIMAQNSSIITNISFLAKELLPSQIVFISSAGGIYDGTTDVFHTEYSTPKPVSPYGIQKLYAECVLKRLSDDIGIPLCIYRVSCAYGFNSVFPDQGVLNKWLFDSIMHGEIKIYNDLNSRLNFISYLQVSRSLELGIDLCVCGTFNIGSRNSTSLMDVYLTVLRLIPNVKSTLIKTDCRFLNLDCSRFEMEVGSFFEPLICDDAEVIFSRIKGFLGR